MIFKLFCLLCSRASVSLENDFVLQICWCTNDSHGLANGLFCGYAQVLLQPQEAYMVLLYMYFELMYSFMNDMLFCLWSSRIQLEHLG